MNRAPRLGAMLALLLAPACTAKAAPEPISIAWRAWGKDFHLRVAPDGRTAIDWPDSTEESPVKRRTLDIGADRAGRFAALVAPVRRWAGGTVPCDARFGSGGFAGAPREEVIATIRWKTSGDRVDLALACLEGPAMAEIRGVHRAIDLLKNADREASPTPSEPQTEGNAHAPQD